MDWRPPQPTPADYAAAERVLNWLWFKRDKYPHAFDGMSCLRYAIDKAKTNTETGNTQP